MILEIILLIAGIILLTIGSYTIVEGVVEIAKRFHISTTIIGLSVISIGTSLPEIATNIKAGLSGASGIALGTSIGSDVAQITLIIGITALLTKVYVTREMLKRDGVMLILSLILMALAGLTNFNISWYEGLILVILYFTYIYSMTKDEKVVVKVKETFVNGNMDIGVHKNNLFNFMLIVIGIMLLIYASDLVVDNAIILAQLWRVEESFIGILIIGVGTSLPELATALMAIARKQHGISIGTLIGSNITDPMLSLGLGAIASGAAGLTVAKNLLYFDIPFWLFVSIVALYLFHKTVSQEKKRIVNGVILIGLYVLFVIIKLVFFMH